MPSARVETWLSGDLIFSLASLISGASGPIGAALMPSLKAGGAAVTCLSRKAAIGADQIAGIRTALVPRFRSGFDAVIHLAGEGNRRSMDPCQEAADPRKSHQGTGHLAEAVAKASPLPKYSFRLPRSDITAIAAMKFCAKTAGPVRDSPLKYAGSGKLPPGLRPRRGSVPFKSGSG